MKIYNHIQFYSYGYILVESYGTFYIFFFYILFVFLLFFLYIFVGMHPVPNPTRTTHPSTPKRRKCVDLYHGINGNVSLDRRGEFVPQLPNRFDLTLVSPDQSGSLSRSEGGVYDIGHAESQYRQKAPIEGQTAINNYASSNGGASNGNISGNASNIGTLESQNGDVRRRV